MKKSCCIFFYEGYIGISPTVINLAELLAEKGYFVTIYATKNGEKEYSFSVHNINKNIYPDYNFSVPNIKVVYFDRGFNILPIKILYHICYFVKKLGLISISETILFIINSLIYTLINYKNIFNGSHLNIGIDTIGAISSMAISYLFKQKFLFLSLEIPSHINVSRLGEIGKNFEKLAYQKAECLLIQDQDRFDSICKFHNHVPSTVFYLPNSPRYSKSAEEQITGNYFRELFNLHEVDFPTIIVQAGMMCDFVFCQELAAAFKNMNNGCALVFHDTAKKSEDDDYVKLLKEINSNNLFVSLYPLPYEEIGRVFSAVTIGIAFYRDVDNNFSQIAKASGKLAQYLRYGKPVLLNNLESFRALVDKYPIGIIIEDPSDVHELEKAIKSIIENYNFYSENSKICFKEEYDFDTAAEPFIAFINSCV